MNFPYHQRALTPSAQRGASSFMVAQTSLSGDDLFFLVEQIHYEFQTRMQTALAGLGLDVRQYTALAYLASGAARAQLDIAAILHLDPSQAVKLAKALEADGLLVRDTSPHDRRSKMLMITDAGQELYMQAKELVQQVQESLTAALSRRDQKALDALLRRVLPIP